MEPATRHIATVAPDPTEIVARARAMIPTLAQRSLEGRRQRRIPDETIADMQHAGFFRVLQPKRWGGYEMELNTFYEIQLALAEGDMSTAWIYGVSGVHPWFMALLDDRDAYSRMSRVSNPYGDGRASRRIALQLMTEAGMPCSAAAC